MRKLILHIPHASVHLPNMEGFVVSPKVIVQEINKLTDWYTDELFYSERDERVIANFSRIFCDVERFADDKKEVMAKYDMGVLYKKNDDGKVIRKVSKELKAKILKDYYHKHHNNLAQVVKNHLNLHSNALIIDCHSFPSEPLQRDLDKRENRPDFNIGTDIFHTDSRFIKAAEAYFKQLRYSLGVDYPYSGTIVPLAFYQKNKNVQSIMLEVNRKLYLDEKTFEKSNEYIKTRKVVQGFLDTMRNLNYTL